MPIVVPAPETPEPHAPAVPGDVDRPSERRARGGDHFDWPLRFVTGGGFALVYQGTARELQASAAVIASVPRGHRDDDPSFGVTSPVWQDGPIDHERMAAEITQADDRLALDATEAVDLANAMRRTLTLHTRRTDA